MSSRSHETDVRIAVVDSGIHSGHPHVGLIADGIHFRADGTTDDDWSDRLGHGTAVAAAIREKVPDAELIAVRVFDRTLSTNAEVLAQAIEWSAQQGAAFINLSLGTPNGEHRARLEAAVAAARSRRATVVSAARHHEVDWLPGSLTGVVGVLLDWECPREEIRRQSTVDGRIVYAASGYPRPIPGVPPERNLKGLSFAVANVTGCLARDLEGEI
ncbi:MAG TPA: S8 family serine peptidase [Gemmatimonadales bacterium]|nr:S8 family serine peptidase [Gemmatimonadales bacterium]